MHYFKRNLGDIAKKTAHLSPLEFGIYNLIMDGYYAREQAPTLMEATRWARARTNEEKEAVLGVLDEFFDLDGEGHYRQSRIDEEITAYHGKAETNRAIAVARESAKRARKEHDSCTTGANLVNESGVSGEPNHKPRTINQEPDKKHKAPAVADAELFPGVDQQIISDFKALRKAKRATITSTAMQTIAAEAERAGLSLNDALRLCCARGWQGFKAEWILDRVAGAQATKNNMQVNHLDHSSSKRAMEESMRKHGITEIPEGEIKF